MKGRPDMARARQIVSVDEKIDKAQDGVARAKAKYDAAVSKLKQLMEKKSAMQKDALMIAVASSDRTYDEIMAFLKDDYGRD
jgi:hypothetical protein